MVSGQQVVLAWESNSTNEDGFAVDESTDGSTFAQIATTGRGVTSYVDMPSQPGTYYYRVRAFNAAGESDHSNVVQVDFLAPDAPPLGGRARGPAFAGLFAMTFSTIGAGISTSKLGPRDVPTTPTTTSMPGKATSISSVTTPAAEQPNRGVVSTALVRNLLKVKSVRNSESISLNALDELFALGMMKLS
jgi:hypothetical protein